jgi:hypothetical protein
MLWKLRVGVVQALSILVSAQPTLRIRAPRTHWQLRRASSRDKQTTAGRKTGPRSCLKITAYNNEHKFIAALKKTHCPQ